MARKTDNTLPRMAAGVAGEFRDRSPGNPFPLPVGKNVAHALGNRRRSRFAMAHTRRAVLRRRRRRRLANKKGSDNAVVTALRALNENPIDYLPFSGTTHRIALWLSRLELFTVCVSFASQPIVQL